MRSRTRVEHKPDILGQAGWMYADLFLALMVIFLATISFIPKVPIATSLPTPQQKGHLDQSQPKLMNQVYGSFDIAKIKSDITAFELSNGIPLTASISYIQIVGGFTKGFENPDQGAMRALVFGLKLSSADPIRFSKIGANLDSSAALKPTEVELKLNFGGA